jgi:hypothetical protein
MATESTEEHGKIKPEKLFATESTEGHEKIKPENLLPMEIPRKNLVGMA